MSTIAAEPCDGDLRPADTALVIIDIRADPCGLGSHVDRVGYHLSLTRAPVEPIRRVLAAMRAGGPPVIHTREGHRPDLSDLPDDRRSRRTGAGAGVGDDGPCGRVLVRGEVVIDEPGKGSFCATDCATDLELILRTRGIRDLVPTGITTDVCVATTMREADGRGFECAVLGECCGARDRADHGAALRMATMQGGVFGAVSSSDALLAGLPS